MSSVSKESTEETDRTSEDEYGFSDVGSNPGTEHFTDCELEELIEGEHESKELEIETEKQKTTLYGKDRKSLNKMTKYELVRLLGEREKQLTLGAKPLIKYDGNMTYDKIAYEELKNKIVPLKIIRNLPNGLKEEWKIEELDMKHLF